jgi:hypothetical protein
MFEIERNKEYDIRLMPNKFDVSNSIRIIDNEKSRMYKIYVTYFLNDDGKIDIIRTPKIIVDYIKHCHIGFYGTSEGYFLCGIENEYIPVLYYANSDKSDIYLSQIEFELNKNKKESYIKYFDVIEYKRFILCDLKGTYKLHFKTCDEQGYMKIYNIGLKKTEPLYKDGEDKNNILSLYDGVYQLKDYNKYLLNEERKDKIKSIL